MYLRTQKVKPEIQTFFMPGDYVHTVLYQNISGLQYVKTSKSEKQNMSSGV